MSLPNKTSLAAPRLGIIDDEKDIGDFLGRVATECGFEVFTATSPSLFLRAARETAYDFIVLDLHMPGVDGVELLRELATLSSRAQILLISGIDGNVLDAAFRLGQERGLDMAGIIRKPIRLQELRRLFKSLTPKQAEAEAAAAPAQITRDDLERAITRRELTVHYQPQIDLQSQAIVGVEALIRWQHPALGVLPPAAFLPLAESSGLIGPMTEWLYGAAIGQCGAWKAQGLHLRLSLNLSGKLPFEYDMPERIAAFCERSCCAPDHVTLELTETAAMDDPVRLIDVFTRLRIKGFHLSIDDFGTGYSSLVQLQRLPFTEMKIDKSFVMTMLESPGSHVIVETIIAMAHSMHMEAVAEGIESADVLDILTRKHCDLAQGYFISRPVPGAKIPELCQAGARRIGDRRPAPAGWASTGEFGSERSPA
jgi:EAL domain-containing protein (putative c-di-GMP-specific phosphodiesterase class I)/ActR/RegA family two-component response regulator